MQGLVLTEVVFVKKYCKVFLNNYFFAEAECHQSTLRNFFDKQKGWQIIHFIIPWRAIICNFVFELDLNL